MINAYKLWVICTEKYLYALHKITPSWLNLRSIWCFQHFSSVHWSVSHWSLVGVILLSSTFQGLVQALSTEPATFLSPVIAEMQFMLFLNCIKHYYLFCTTFSEVQVSIKCWKHLKLPWNFVIMQCFSCKIYVNKILNCCILPHISSHSKMAL